MLDFGIENTWWCHGTLTDPPLLPNIGIDALEQSDVPLLDRGSKEQLCREATRQSRTSGRSS